MLVLTALVGGRTVTAAAVPSLAWQDGSVLDSREKRELRRLTDGVDIELAPGTRVVRRGLIRVTLEKGNTAHALQLELLSGRMDIRIDRPKDNPRPVVVRAPRKITAMAQAGHSVVVAGRDVVAVAAFEGKMGVALDDTWRPLAEGWMRAFTSTDPAGRPRPLLGATQPHVESQLLLVVPGRDRPVLSADWPAVPGATAYDLVLEERQGSERRVVRHSELTQPEVRLDSLRPGTYELTVRALDPWGVGGRVSPPLSLRVVSALLPRGACVEDETVRIGLHQKIAFTNVQNMELSYGEAKDFVPIPASVGLRLGHGVVVRLRVPGQPDEARIAIAPHAVEADVEIGPRSARWPDDTVTAGIRLRGPGEDAMCGEAAVEPKVTINGEEIETDWTRHDDRLASVIPPPDSPGPWVVRVQVFDSFGDLVGRSFLEVVGRPRRR
jgi:hypothetical protein